MPTKKNQTLGYFELIHPPRYDVDDDVCGETIDHILVERGSSEGETVYECGRCGAEIVEEDE